MGSSEGSTAPQAVYTVTRPANAPPVTVRREDLLSATERGLSRAHTGLVAPVDRELAMRIKPAATATPATPQ